MEKLNVKKRVLEFIYLMSEDQLKDLLKHLEGQKKWKKETSQKKMFDNI